MYVCVSRDFTCALCYHESVCVFGGIAAERFINPVHEGSVRFTLRHQRLKDVSATQARQCLSKILISAIIFYCNNPPPPTHHPATLLNQHYKSNVFTVQVINNCFNSLLQPFYSNAHVEQF